MPKKRGKFMLKITRPFGTIDSEGGDSVAKEKIRLADLAATIRAEDSGRNLGDNIMFICCACMESKPLVRVFRRSLPKKFIPGVIYGLQGLADRIVGKEQDRRSYEHFIAQIELLYDILEAPSRGRGGDGI